MVVVSPPCPEDKNIMDVALHMQIVQMEMMQMLREVKEEIFRIRENSTNYSNGYCSDLDDILVSFSSVTIDSLSAETHNLFF